jgi:hypothetical protein
MISTNSKTTPKSLNSFISLNDCTGLNVEGSEEIREAFGFGGIIKSNKNDPEVIILVKFKENVNISGIRIDGPMEEEKRPSVLQLFTNNSSIDFGDIGSLPSTESVKLEASNFGKCINLKIAKFRNTTTLTV